MTKIPVAIHPSHRNDWIKARLPTVLKMTNELASLSGIVEIPRLQAKHVFAKSRRNEHLKFFDKAAAGKSNLFDAAAEPVGL